MKQYQRTTQYQTEHHKNGFRLNPSFLIVFSKQNWSSQNSKLSYWKWMHVGLHCALDPQFSWCYFIFIDILCDDCAGTLTFGMRLSFASLILCQVRHKIEGECTKTRLPMTWLCCLLHQFTAKLRSQWQWHSFYAI